LREDPEDGQTFWLQGNSRKTRSLLAERAARIEEALKRASYAQRGYYLVLQESDDYLKRVAHFFR
jgi:hypothetical protein